MAGLFMDRLWPHDHRVYINAKSYGKSGAVRCSTAATCVAAHVPPHAVRTPRAFRNLTKQTEVVPAALALNVRHNGVVHEHVVLLQVTTSRAPRVAKADRVVELGTKVEM